MVEELPQEILVIVFKLNSEQVNLGPFLLVCYSFFFFAQNVLNFSTFCYLLLSLTIRSEASLMICKLQQLPVNLPTKLFSSKRNVSLLKWLFYQIRLLSIDCTIWMCFRWIINKMCLTIFLETLHHVELHRLQMLLKIQEE